MARDFFSKLLSATLVASALVSVGMNQPVLAKSKRHIASAGRGAYFVPPPPPYAPSILPESYAHVRTTDADAPVAEVAEKPPENPYRKYIFTRDAGDMPRVVRFGKTAQSSRNVITYLHNKT
jgi:hypothetical protein